jgi:hypothetical protein
LIQIHTFTDSFLVACFSWNPTHQFSDFEQLVTSQSSVQSSHDKKVLRGKQGQPMEITEPTVSATAAVDGSKDGDAVELEPGVSPPTNLVEAPVLSQLSRLAPLPRPVSNEVSGLLIGSIDSLDEGELAPSATIYNY